MKTSHIKKYLAVAASLSVSASAYAATWTGTTNGSWSTLTNWSDGLAPNGIVAYDAGSTANLTQTLDGNHTIDGILVGSPAGAVTINKGTATSLTIGASGIDMSAATANLSLGSTLASSGFNIITGASQSWTTSSGSTLTLGRQAGTITFSTGTTTTINGTGTVEFGGSGNTVLTGAGDLVIGSGTVKANMQGGTQGRTGATTINGGTTIVSTSLNMFGTGALNINGGTIGSGTGTARTFANALAIGGNFQVGGTTGGTTTAIVFSGATDLGGATRTITSLATTVVTNSGAGAIFSGVVSNGGITKEGAGYVTLSNNANTFSGAVTINAGSLAFAQKALAGGSSVTLANSGVNLVIGQNGTGTHDINDLSGVAGSIIRSDFSLSGTNTARTLKITQGIDGIFAGNFTEGTGRTIALVKEGSAKLTLSGSGTRYTGGTTVNAGTLTAGSATAFGSGSITVNGGKLDLNGYTIANTTTINGGDLALGTGGTVSVSGTATVGTLSGTGTITGNVSSTNLAVGNSPGFIQITGDYSVSGTTTMEVWGNLDAGPVNGYGDGTYDNIYVTGNLTVGGDLNVVFGDSTGLTPYTPVAGDVYTFFFVDGAISGTFANVNLPDISGLGLAWDTTNLYANGSIAVSAVPEPSSFACVMGLLVLGTTCTRRRRRD